MKTFLINEQFKKTRMGGKGICRVFIIQDNGIYIECVDITRRISEITKREKSYDGLCLTIHYGSGTGISVLTEAIKTHWGKVNIHNVSIF